MTVLNIALIGNPNCGKTTIFNHICKSSQKIGNWPGVTVEHKSAHFCFKDKEFNLIDLPGIYSLSTAFSSQASDVKITKEWLFNKKIDLIINVIDSANIERNLYLTTQLLEANIPMIICANMNDVARSHGMKIDVKRISNLIKYPVICTIANKKIGIDTLQEALLVKIKSSKISNVLYDQQLEDDLKFFDQYITSSNKRWLAIRLLENDQYVIKNIINASNEKEINDKKLLIQKKCDLDIDLIIADARYKLINKLLDGSYLNKHNKATRIIDKFVLNRFLGIPIFVMTMYLVFGFSTALSDTVLIFDDLSKFIFVDTILYLDYVLGFPDMLTIILVNGVGVGVNTVATFLPQIFFLFLFLCALEECGYISRTAFIMDKFMQFVKLPGRAFIPLIVSFGCNVPGIMACRTLNSKYDRFVAIMMSPYMSCTARLVVFVVFTNAFFNVGGGLIILLLYILGIIAALLTAWILNKIFLINNDEEYFIDELPEYYIPSLKIVIKSAWKRSKQFIVRAGKLIVPICILIGSLDAINIKQNKSILASFGQTITPIFKPMGISDDNWQATVGLITGILAKEVVIGTLNTLYNDNEKEAIDKTVVKFNFTEKIKNIIINTINSIKNLNFNSFLSPFAISDEDVYMDKRAMNNMTSKFTSVSAVLAFMVFSLLYIPCVSVLGVMTRETNGKLTALAVFWSSVLAYTLAVITFQLGNIIVAPITSSLYIISMLCVIIASIYFMKYLATNKLKVVA